METGALQALLLANDERAALIDVGPPEPFNLFLPLGCLSGVLPQNDTVVFARLVPVSPILLESQAVVIVSSCVVPHVDQLDPNAFHLVVFMSIFIDVGNSLNVLVIVGSCRFRTFS